MPRRGFILAAALPASASAISCFSAQAEIDAAAYITVRPGGVPVIVSAPHGGDKLLPGVAMREDRGQRFFATVRDQNTAELAEKLAAELGKRLGSPPYVVIAHFDRRHIDANRAPKDAYAPTGDGGPGMLYHAYHTALANAAGEVERRWGGGLLLDLHGQSRFPDRIIRGTRNGQTVKSLVRRAGAEAVTGPQSLLGALAKLGYKIAPTGGAGDLDERHYVGGHIVDTHGSAEGGNVDAIQVEVGSRFRTLERLERTARDLAAATEIFVRAYMPSKPK